MTPEQMIKHAILVEHWKHNSQSFVNGEITSDDIDSIYDEVMVEQDYHWDAQNEFRENGEETNLPCDWSRHYESKSVAAQMPNGSWVGWTYWSGGGKHGEPESIDWMDTAYFVDCEEEEKIMTVRTFSKPEIAA